jgi:hypothetical protein
MITLIATSAYRCRRVAYDAGQRFTVTEEEALALMADAPGVFVIAVPPVPEPETTALDAPPLDRAVHSPRRRK